MATVPAVDARLRAAQRQILVLSADQTLASAIAALDAAAPLWVVVIREEEWAPEPFLYAFRPTEVRARTDGRSGSELLKVALQLNEGGSSETRAEDGQRLTPSGGTNDPSAQRAVIVDIEGTPAAVAELRRAVTSPVRSRPSDRPVAMAPPKPDMIDVRLSANAPAVIGVGSDDVIDVLISAAEDAFQVPGAILTTASKTEPISVLLSIFGSAVVATGSKRLTMDPPKAGAPSQSAFEIRAIHEGVVQVAVIFRQGGSELGNIRHQIRVSATGGSLDRASGEAVAAPRTPNDAGVLLLQVEPLIAGGEIRYQYRVHSVRLGLDFETFESPRLLAPDGSAAQSELAFVNRIYANMTNKALRTKDEIKRFAVEVAAFAEDLCDQLFPQDLTRLLLSSRDKIDAIRVMSWEPYIPWEMIKLSLPNEQKSDDRFLGQLGMVRWLAGRSAARTLSLGAWSYYAATYSENPNDNVVKEVDYFTTRLPQRGIKPVQVAATYDAFVGALQNPSFDVLHIACHGDVKEDNIEKADLIIADEVVAGRPKFVSISANVVKKIARFGMRRPLVFLNACEAGRLGESLTTWGGWPSRLISAGAGAVVGASWPVRDVASNVFATTFYDALLDGKVLAVAASEARAKAAEIGDATWLSFKVFGDPHAARET